MFRILIALLFLFSARTVLAQELMPRTDFTVSSYSELSEVKSEIWLKYNERRSAAYDARQEAETAAFEVYREKRLVLLNHLRKADWNNYVKWLDAKEIGDYDRRNELEKTYRPSNRATQKAGA